MAPITRRSFLLGAGAAALTSVGGALTVGRLLDGGGPAATPPDGTAPEAASGDGRLVVLFLDGGNDALNTVVPIGAAAGADRYVERRGDLAIDPASALDLGEGFGLHPALSGTKRLWDAGRLAVVHGVGFTGLDRSHFHCRDVWHAGDDHDHATGWIGRWLDRTATSPLDAVAVGNRLPLVARGVRRSAAVVPVGPFTLPGDDALRRGLTTIAGGADEAGGPLLAAVAASTADLLEVVDRLPAAAPDAGTVDPGSGGALAAKFDTVARLIEADLPTRVFAVDLGGFDTHANQAEVHRELLAEVDGAVTPFLDRFPSGVTVLVYSEFGRRVAANASAGTDHGGGGTLLVAGDVRGGHHGAPPSLERLVDGDLAGPVDFRSVYAELLGGVLAIDPADVLDSPPPPLTLVR